MIALIFITCVVSGYSVSIPVRRALIAQGWI